MVNAAFLRVRIAPDPVEPAPVDFGEWLPDLPANNNPGAIEALNVIPSEGSYVPFPQFTSLVDGTGEVRGGAFLFDRYGGTQLYMATVNDINLRVGAAFATRYTTPFTLYSDYLWQFVPFGKYIVALHPQLAPLVGEVGGASAFSPLAGAPPIAAVGARVGDFLVLGDLDNEDDPDGARQPSRIRWSPQNNIEGPWISDPATQADFNDMPSEGGRVTGITGREYGTIFQERSISRMTYEGLPSVFSIETVEEERGAMCSGGIIDLGSLVYFIAGDGFFVWNGTNAVPIGDNKVNRYFFNKLNFGARGRIVGAYDAANKCIVWAFPSGASSVLAEAIIYSTVENRFSHVVVNVDYIINGATLDISLDALTGNLDVDFPITLDDGSFRGGKPILGGFQNGDYGLFSGSPMAATIDTGEFGAPNGRRVFTNNSRPIVDVSAPVVTMQVAQRDQLLGDAPVFSTATAQEITGECPILADARYMRFRANIPAGASWRHARGVEIWRKATGKR